MYAEGSDVGSSLTAQPENGQVVFLVKIEKLGLVDGPNAQFFFNCGNKRGLLEDRTCQALNCVGKLGFIVNMVMKFDHGNVLLTSGLLCLNQSSRVVDAHNQAASDLGVEGSGVPSFFHLKNVLDPGDNFVGRWVGGLVEVDNAVFLELFDRSGHGRPAVGQGSEVTGADVQLIVIFEEEGPVRGITLGAALLGLDGVGRLHGCVAV